MSSVHFYLYIILPLSIRSFLSDPSPTIEDANSKLVDVVTVADFDDEDHVNNSRSSVLDGVLKNADFFTPSQSQVGKSNIIHFHCFHCVYV